MRIRQTEEKVQKTRDDLLLKLRRQMGSDAELVMTALDEYIDARIELAKPIF